MYFKDAGKLTVVDAKDVMLLNAKLPMYSRRLADPIYKDVGAYVSPDVFWS